jgi:hypothetical protein
VELGLAVGTKLGTELTREFLISLNVPKLIEVQRGQLRALMLSRTPMSQRHGRLELIDAEDRRSAMDH